MEHLLFAGYLILFAWAVTKVKFFTRSGLTPSQLIIAFLLKVMAGIFYGWIAIYQNTKENLTDTWSYHLQSIKEVHLLIKDPYEFFASIIRPSADNAYNYFLTNSGHYWNSIDNILLNKVLALFNVFSAGDYYINVLFYSFISFFGPIGIYRVMKNHFSKSNFLLLAFCFFLPSFLFWTSGLHKDGIIFLGISLVVYNLYFGLAENRFNLYRLVKILLGLVLIICFRYYLIITVLPACFAWVLSHKFSHRIKPVYFFVSAYALFVLLFFVSKFIYPEADFPKIVSLKQEEFFTLIGNSKIETQKLDPTFKSFLYNLPQALSISIIRPFITDAKNTFSLVATIENTILLILYFLFLINRKKHIKTTPFLLFCFFFSFSVFLIIGYTVNFLGATVRYRSIVLPFFIIPIAININWERIRGFWRYIYFKYNV